MRLGTCVTNPATREPTVTASALATLDEMSRRADGPRHRARRLRAARARQAADHDGHAEEAITRHPGLVEGRTIEYEGTELQLPWTGRWTLPVWVAGYGPMALAMTGASPTASSSSSPIPTSSAGSWPGPRGRAAAGRDPPSIKVLAAAPRPRRRRRRRPRPDALVPGAGLQPRRRSRQQVPARRAARQPHRLHPRPRRATTTSTTRRSARRTPAFVGDEVTDRFCVLGSRRRARRQAARAGRRRRRPVQRLPDERRRGGRSSRRMGATSSRPCRLTSWAVRPRRASSGSVPIEEAGA